MYVQGHQKIKPSRCKMYTYTVYTIALQYYGYDSTQILHLESVLLCIKLNDAQKKNSFDSTTKLKLLHAGMSSCPIIRKYVKARAAELDNGGPVRVVILLLAELLLCPAVCLQAEWAQRMSRSLATCEHSPPLLCDLTLNSSEDRGKGGAEQDMKTVYVKVSAL